jgi:cytochrome b561
MCGVQVRDTTHGYGWISIGLHWVTAAIVVTMFTIGSMSQGRDQRVDVGLVDLHTSIGVAVYLLLWLRIFWRLKVGHPGPLPRQNAWLFVIGKCFHFMFLAAIAVMLVSGPLMVWSNRDAIQVFGLALPSPLGPFPKTHVVLRAIHGYTASFILAAMILHVLAVFWHAVIKRDGTFDKIMIADQGRPE